MKTNRQMLSKKDQIAKMVALPSIVLEAEEADRFIDYVVDESVMKNSARVVKMNKVTKNIRALGLGSDRFLYPADTFTSSDYLKTLTDEKIELIAKKMRGAVAIFDDDLEDNIEADAFADHVMRMVAARIANELDEIFWIGDTDDIGGFAGTDSRSLFDGWRHRIKNSQVSGSGYLSGYYNTVSGRATMMTAKAATVWATTPGAGGTATQGMIVHPDTANGFVYICTVGGVVGGSAPTFPTTLGTTVVDNLATWRCHAYDCILAGKIAEQNSSAPYNWEFKYNNMLKRLPSKYKKTGLKNLRFFQSDQLTQDYVTALSARATILGDKAVLGEGPLSAGQVPIIPCPNMPMTMSEAGVSGGGTYGDTLLTPKGNLIIGIYRNLKIESQRVAADEATYWFYSMRADNAIENVNACVLLENITTA